MSRVTAEPGDETWLLISVSTAGAPGTLRVQVWRKLRSLGALYLQQSVCLLPARPEVVREVGRLVDRIRHQGGTARVVRIRITDPAERAGIVAEINNGRDAEYNELLERLPSFTSELATERARGRASYLEVEENEADLHRFRTWLAKISSRDYFNAPRAQTAQQALTTAEHDFRDFEAEAIRLETDPEPAAGQQDSAAIRLRAVGEARPPR